MGMPEWVMLDACALLPSFFRGFWRDRALSSSFGPEPALGESEGDGRDEKQLSDLY